jgi:hypothetical protein
MHKNSSNTITLLTLAGVEGAQVDGDFITGRWRTDLVYLKSGAHNSVVETFANWGGSPIEIANFTRRFGPLTRPPEHGELTFRQSIADWRDAQAFIRQRWSSGRSLGLTVGMRKGEEIHFDRQGKVNKIILESLARFMEFQLWTHPRAYRLKCANPNCDRPFLIATRVDQQVCDYRPCLVWAQRKYKREWWAAHGEQWRKVRTKKQKKAKRSLTQSGIPHVRKKPSRVQT